MGIAAPSGRAEQLDAEVQALADNCSAVRRLPCARANSLLNRPLETELEHAFQNELEAIMRCFGTADAHEATCCLPRKTPTQSFRENNCISLAT